MGDSQHTQNAQINKVIGENEKCVFYFTEKTKWTFWPTQYSQISIMFLRQPLSKTKQQNPVVTQLTYEPVLVLVSKNNIIRWQEEGNNSGCNN